MLRLAICWYATSLSKQYGLEIKSGSTTHLCTCQIFIPHNRCTQTMVPVARECTKSSTARKSGGPRIGQSPVLSAIIDFTFATSCSSPPTTACNLHAQAKPIASNIRTTFPLTPKVLGYTNTKTNPVLTCVCVWQQTRCLDSTRSLYPLQNGQLVGLCRITCYLLFSPSSCWYHL